MNNGNLIDAAQSNFIALYSHQALMSNVGQRFLPKPTNRRLLKTTTFLNDYIYLAAFW